MTKITNNGRADDAYSCNHMATVGVKGLRLPYNDLSYEDTKS